MSDVPVTPVYGLPYERWAGLSGRTLTGGPTGEDPVLAEAVEAELQRVDGDVQDVRQALDRGWIPIASGFETGNFPIDFTRGGDFPPGHFEMIRLYFRGSHSTLGYLNFRINNDTQPEMHRRNWIVVDAATHSTIEHDADTATSWRAGRFSENFACTSEVLLQNTHQETRLSYQAVGQRPASGPTVTQWFRGWGDLDSPRLVTFVQCFPSSGSIAQMWWRAEGWRSP